MSSKFVSAKYLFRAQGPLLVLVAVMFLIFFAQCIFGPGAYFDFMAVPGKVVQAWNDLRGGKAGPEDWWNFGTLLSCAFLHGDFEHVGFNMIYFWIFGALIVELLGWRWMLGIFVVTAIAASISHTLMNKEDFIPMLGASGAVMGFEGAYLGLATRWKLPDPHIWPMAHAIPPGHLALLAIFGVCVDYYFIMSGSQSNTAYGAHVGGFTMGLFIAALVAPRPRGAGASSWR